MRIKCIANTGEVLSKETLDIGYSKEWEFDLSIDSVFVVYGILMSESSLSYLLSKREYDNPFWYPAELFEIVDHLFPLEWYFNLKINENIEERHSQTAIWGYKEIVLDQKYYDALFEREPEALDIFFKRKKEIDEYLDLSKFIHKK